MRWRTFMIGWVLAAAVLLLAHRPAPIAQPSLFREVVDLTHTVNISAGDPRWERTTTKIDASAHAVSPERLIAPLVVLDVRARVAHDPDYQVSLDDVARWEQANGHVPPGAVVMARTGWEADPHHHVRRAPGFSPDVARFLVEGRIVFGLGIDTPSVDAGGAPGVPVRQYLGEKQVYALENVANLDRAPSAGAMVVVAPSKIQQPSGTPVRLLALVR